VLVGGVGGGWLSLAKGKKDKGEYISMISSFACIL
jgi:hypothetical protein